jgi:hypothetical protein
MVIWSGNMSWDDHEGWCVEIMLFGLILQFAIGKHR